MLKKLKSLCKKKGVTIAEMERSIGLSKGASYKWKTSTPSSEVIKKIADYFNVTVDSLLKDNTDQSSGKAGIDLSERLNELLAILLHEETVYFSGEAIDDISKQLLINSLEKDIETLNIINKR